jgi:hypothetical protein
MRKMAEIVLVLLAVFFLAGCEQPAGAPKQGTTPEEPLLSGSIGYSVSADGVNGVEDSTILSFTFDEPVSGLTAENISLANGAGAAAKGALTGEGAAWSLGIAVARAGDLKVKIARGGIAAEEKTVSVYRAAEHIALSWEARVNGEANKEPTTAIVFTFSGPLEALSADNIRLDPGTGTVFPMDLYGNGKTWTLIIAVEKAGTIGAAINLDGVQGGTKSITVHKGYEALPPEKVAITVLSPPDTTYYGRNMAFDATGLVVAWLYNDGSTEEIPSGGYTMSNPNMAQYTPKLIILRAGGFETSFVIQVVNTEKVLQSISASGPDNKTQVFSREFDRTGLVVTGHFSDGSTADLSSLAAIVGYNKFKRGPQAVSVKVNGKTASLEGISTRLAEDATITAFFGFGVKTTFIKGETMTPEKANLSVTMRPGGAVFQSEFKQLSLENGGLLPEDFDGLVAAYDPNRIGKQTLSMTLDGRSFDVDLYVADAEPDAWFDFGYMRHEGDPTGAGPGAGKYYAQPNETLIIAPVRYLIGYNDDHSDAGVSYSWTVSGGDSSRTYSISNGGEFLHITPKIVGTYAISVSITGRNYVSGSDVTKTAQAELVCYTGTVSAGGKTFTSPLKNFGAGQMCEGGTGLGWSLGSAGGYEVWAVHPNSVYNIYGNAFGSWNEAGIVWVQEDRNGNGLPDEMWYELTGGDETHSLWKNYITRRYALTYYKVEGKSVVNEYGQLIRGVYWVDSRGRAGMIPGGFPDKYWGVVGDRVTYTTTLLRDDGRIHYPSYNLVGLTGYVDTVDDCKFLVSDAIYADGTPAPNFPGVKFLKVQTAIFRYGDIFGDVSTEISYGDDLPRQSGSFPMP